MISLTTEAVRPSERVDYWEDLITRHVTPMAMEPSRETPLRGEVTAHVFGGVGIAEVSGQGIHASHRRAEVAGTGNHLYAACINLEGTAKIIRRGEEVALYPGDVFITDSRQEFAFDLGRPWRHLVLSMATEWLDSRLASSEQIGGIVVRGKPLMRLWASYLAKGFSMAKEFTPAAEAVFARHSVELLAQALEELRYDRPSQSDAYRAALFERACQVIALRFAESDLSPEIIARSLGVSSRSLSRVFAAHGETVMRRVMDERVGRARKLLATSAVTHRTITHIAFTCGFIDSSHFGRVFMERTGLAPSQWRRENSEVFTPPGEAASKD